MTTTMPSTTSTPVYCQHCGCKSILPQLFQSSEEGMLCPVCAAKRALRKEQLTFGGLLFLIVVNIGGSWLLRGEPGQFGLGMLFVLGVMVLLILLHELSHAIAGWLLGGRVFGIHLGVGRLLFQHWLGNFYVGVSLLPASGICFVGFPPGKGNRLRFGLMVLAGPLFHLLLLLLLLPSPRARLGLPFNPWVIILMITNALLLFINLWPWLKVQTAIGGAQGDGNQLWQLVRGQITTDQLQQSYYYLAASFALQQRQETQALAEISEGLARYPANPILRQLHGYLLMRQHRLAESLVLWQTQLAEPPAADVPPVLHGYLQALHYNNCAWTLLLLRRNTDDLATAGDYADRAFAMTPWITPVRGTLAAARVARGDYAAGIALALAVAEEHRKLHHPLAQENRAANLATAAVGYHHQGNAAEARHLLAEAQSLAPQDLAVQQAATAIENAA